MKKVLFVICTVLLFSTAVVSQTENASTSTDVEVQKKATEWVSTLVLNDPAKESRVQATVFNHLKFITDWHNSHPYTLVPEGINPRTGEKLNTLDRQIIVDSSMPDSVHINLMSGLRNELTEEQVERILDQYTIGKVAFTLKGYKAIVPDLTTEEEAVILMNLKAAREMAVDYKSMKEISAIFEIYKTKNEQYLNSNGRNWRELFNSYVKSRKKK